VRSARRVFVCGFLLYALECLGGREGGRGRRGKKSIKISISPFLLYPPSLPPSLLTLAESLITFSLASPWEGGKK